jgi:hypothetical protein
VDPSTLNQMVATGISLPLLMTTVGKHGVIFCKKNLVLLMCLRGLSH